MEFLKVWTAFFDKFFRKWDKQKVDLQALVV